MRVSAKAWAEYRQKLHNINTKAEKAMDKFMKEHWPSDSQDMIDFAYTLTSRYGNAAAELACQMYDKTVEASGLYLPPAEPAETASYEDVQKAIYSTLKAPKLTPRAINRLVKRASADTTLKNAKRDKAQWAWIPYGQSCAFCLTLASRGWQDASKAVLKGNHAEHIHANCDCNFQIRFSESDSVEGYEPDKLLKIYEDAEGKTPEEKINSLRRTIELKSDKEYIQDKIKSGEWGMTINFEKQAPHMESTRKKGKSYLFDIEDPQKLLDKYAGTGELIKTITGKRTNKEIVEIDHQIGIDYNSNEKTNYAKIHHSLKRTHIVPYRNQRKR